MLDLIYKDIVQNRKLILLYALIGGFIGLAMMMASGSDMAGVFTAYVMISTYGFALRSTYDEDKSGAYLFLKSLPLSDAAIVTSKFVSVFAVSVILVIFFNITAVFGAYLASSGIIPGFGPAVGTPGTVDVAAILGENAVSFAMVFSMAMVVTGVYLVMFFWVGFAKASAYSRAILFAIFALVMIGVGSAGRSPAIQNLALTIETSSWVSVVSVVIGLVVYWICCAVSVLKVAMKDWS